MVALMGIAEPTAGCAPPAGRPIALETGRAQKKPGPKRTRAGGRRGEGGDAGETAPPHGFPSADPRGVRLQEPPLPRRPAALAMTFPRAGEISAALLPDALGCPGCLERSGSGGPP